MKRNLFLIVMFIGSLCLFTGSTFAIEVSGTGEVEIHGFVTQGYIYTNHNNFFADTEKDGTTQFNEAGLNFSADVGERLRMGVQFFARDLGKMGDMEVTIDWAYADYSFYDWLKLRAGKVKLPYGLYNTERDVDMLRTFVFLPQGFYFEGWRDSVTAMNGGGVYGYIPVGFAGNLEYQMYSGSAYVNPEGGVARLLEDQTPLWMGLDVYAVDVEYTHAGTLTWDTVFGLDGLRFVTGAWIIEFDAHSTYNNGSVTPHLDPTTGAPNGDFTMATSESIFNTKNFTKSISIEWVVGSTVLAAEYMTNEYELTLPVETTIDPSGVIVKEFDSVGWYGSITHRFFDWLEAGVYYGEYFADNDDKDGDKIAAEYVASGGLTGVPPDMKNNRWLKDTCLAARFDISANWLFKLEGHLINGTALLYSDDGNVDATGMKIDYEEDWHMVAAKLSFNF